MSHDCRIKAEIKSIDELSEVTGAGATVHMTVKILESSCAEKAGERRIHFAWDPKGRFLHRLEKLGQTNAQISAVSVFKSGAKIEALMDSHDHRLSELNGLRLPTP